jgi:hypothetical protein
MVNFELDFSPDALIPNLVCRPLNDDGTYTPLSAEQAETLKGVSEVYQMKRETLCRACGWNTYHECTSSYLPRLRVQHTRANGGMWVMGNDWLVWDRTQEEKSNDYITHQFLQKHGVKDIPLVKRMEEFNDADGKYNFVVMSRARGTPLENAWPGLSQGEKDGYVRQMVDMLRELRSFTAEYPQRVDGGPLWDNVIGNCESRKECIKVGKTAEEWIDNMDEELREGLSRQMRTKDKAVIEAKMQEFKVR